MPLYVSNYGVTSEKSLKEVHASDNSKTTFCNLVVDSKWYVHYVLPHKKFITCKGCLRVIDEKNSKANKK